MNAVPVLNFQDFIDADGETLTTDSLKVAQVHGKRHNDVLRFIRNRIEEAGDWGLRNFAQGSYFDQRNQQHHPMFTMPQAGYQFLVGKMTGKKAVEHQIAFIDAFKAMAGHIKNQRDGLRYRRKRGFSAGDSARQLTRQRTAMNPICFDDCPAKLCCPAAQASANSSIQ